MTALTVARVHANSADLLYLDCSSIMRTFTSSIMRTFTTTRTAQDGLEQFKRKFTCFVNKRKLGAQPLVPFCPKRCRFWNTWCYSWLYSHVSSSDGNLFHSQTSSVAHLRHSPLHSLLLFAAFTNSWSCGYL